MAMGEVVARVVPPEERRFLCAQMRRDSSVRAFGVSQAAIGANDPSPDLLATTTTAWVAASNAGRSERRQSTTRSGVR